MGGPLAVHAPGPSADICKLNLSSSTLLMYTPISMLKSTSHTSNVLSPRITKRTPPPSQTSSNPWQGQIVCQAHRQPMEQGQTHEEQKTLLGIPSQMARLACQQDYLGASQNDQVHHCLWGLVKLIRVQLGDQSQSGDDFVMTAPASVPGQSSIKQKWAGATNAEKLPKSRKRKTTALVKNLPTAPIIRLEQARWDVKWLSLDEMENDVPTKRKGKAPTMAKGKAPARAKGKSPAEAKHKAPGLFVANLNSAAGLVLPSGPYTVFESSDDHQESLMYRSTETALPQTT
ncbi:hypothetical protein BDK51DRAFT_49390 [Blyttiomyces helicus]|uniref:Uncharacterized protein n=1 Tax=Blyttiomyces helicus TaxID=388810 RepID=A0A4V1IQ14_9FUNG|nr:hypothetical protein BDK51DRAFT_49390 [Blyttiomyces helicus]|eukprot:RKO84967.1 hypothetical protein BDK51DRAFT_49390 [Blyttiomyces helicus]